VDLTDDLDRMALAQSWVHAHEEDDAGRMVFRPADQPMPPSRGRRSLDLSSVGKAGFGLPGPDDRPTSREGSWSLEGRRLVLHHDGGDEVFEVDSLEPDRLALRPTTE